MQGAWFDAKVVADPTLLLDYRDYLDLKTGIEKDRENYLFAYILNVRSKEDTSWNEIARYVDGSRLSVRAVYSSGCYQARPLIPNIEPELSTVQEWLAAIRDARCVITTSFHGVVFCVLFHTPFVVFSLAGRRRANDRLIALLSHLGLSERLYAPSEPFSRQMNKPIDWDRVDKRLSSLGWASKKFLSQALENEIKEGEIRG